MCSVGEQHLSAALNVRTLQTLMLTKYLNITCYYLCSILLSVASTFDWTASVCSTVYFYSSLLFTQLLFEQLCCSLRTRWISNSSFIWFGRCLWSLSSSYRFSYRPEQVRPTTSKRKTWWFEVLRMFKNHQHGCLWLIFHIKALGIELNWQKYWTSFMTYKIKPAMIFDVYEKCSTGGRCQWRQFTKC